MFFTEAANWLRRYRSGEHLEVWSEMIALGPDVGDGPFFAHAQDVVTETMTRVRANVETVRARLRELGYRFEGVTVHNDADPAVLRELEATLGPLPLSLATFYRVVGTVDFRQSFAQAVQWHRREGRSVSDLVTLGEEDPLVVNLINPDDRPWINDAGEAWCFAPDEMLKANYSGGANYHVVLPNRAADFRIVGPRREEWFVAYLRTTFANGGFRGRVAAPQVGTGESDPETSPANPLAHRLAEGLLPF